MKKAIAMMVLAFTLIGLSCRAVPVPDIKNDSSDGLYDRLPYFPEVEIEKIKPSILDLVAEFELKHKIEDRRQLRGKLTRAFAVSPHRILTASHSFEFEITNIPDPQNWHTAERRVFLGNRQLAVACQNKENDLVVFAAPPDIKLLYFSGPWGKGSELKEGQAILIFGFPRQTQLLIRPGIVAAVNLFDKKVERKAEGLFYSETANPEFFITSFGVVQGDSGSPVFAFRDGKAEFVGIISKGFVDRGFALPTGGLVVKADFIAQKLNCLK